MNIKQRNIENAFKSFVKTAIDALPEEDRQQAYEDLIELLIELQGESE